MEQLSNKIRRLRFENGEMTQKARAEQVGISRQTMNAIENCRHAPTVSVAIRIADVFQVSVDDLFDLEYEGKPAPPEKAVRATVDQLPTPTRAPLEIKNRPAPTEKQIDREITLADLRNLI